MKRLTGNLLLSFFAFLSIIFTVSCKSSKILSAGFESDVLNQPPATNLAGDPSGDVIQFVPELASQLSVENSSDAGKKAMHLMNVPVSVGGHSKWISFRGISTNLVETLWFTYAAKNNNPAGHVMIDVSDGAGHLLARMRIHSNGDIRLAKNILDDYTDLIGNIGQNAHTVVFTTSPSSLKYNVTVFQTGGSAITAENKPMITTNALEFANPAHPTISFSHASTGSGNHHYIIESVSISRKKPN
jgi:hypothetical protein